MSWHSSSVLVAIRQQLNTGHSHRLRLPSYYVSQRKASQHYLKIRPLTTAHGKREGKWKTDKAPPNKQEERLRRICSLLLVWAVGRLYNRRSHESWLCALWHCVITSVWDPAKENETERIKPKMFTVVSVHFVFVPSELWHKNRFFGAVKCLERQMSEMSCSVLIQRAGTTVPLIREFEFLG